MKKTILFAVLAIASAAWAQVPAPAKDAAKPDEAAKPAAEAPKSQPKKTAAVAKKSRRQQDARHCLERGSNLEIIKCAEAYL
jgi:hypothetical protein